eukprot:2563558-Rhodomonas_salina.1
MIQYGYTPLYKGMIISAAALKALLEAGADTEAKDNVSSCLSCCCSPHSHCPYPFCPCILPAPPALLSLPVCSFRFGSALTSAVAFPRPHDRSRLL